MHTIINDAECQATAGIRRPTILESLIGVYRCCRARVALWQARARQRRSLATLDAHMLHDIGVSRMDAAREAAKPFWKA